MTDVLVLLADRLDPTPVDVFALLDYTPTERQAEFHQATEFDVLYGGAAGGGKTKALLMDDLRDCVRYPGLRIGAFRRTYDELAESFFKELISIDYASVLGCHWNGTEKELRFPNGSVIRYRYLEAVRDATRRQGGEYQKVTIDERTLIPPEAVSILVEERIRSGRADLPVIGVRSGTNPGGIGHGPVYSRFIEKTNYGEYPYEDDFGRSVRFIQAKVADNPHVNKEYSRSLDAIPDPARRRAMRDGDWDSAPGMFFPEWSRHRHIVPSFPVPPEWLRRAGIDYGYGAPWATIWGARDQDGRVWLYREHYEAEVGEKDQARRILAAETDEHGVVERVAGHHADPSMWARRGDSHPIAAVYSTEGCPLIPAENDRLSGWTRVHSYLADGPACEHHRSEGLAECPMLHVLEGTCDELAYAIPNAPRDPDKPEDVDTDYSHDHDLDALRYLLMAFPLRPPRKPAPPEDRSAEARVARHIQSLDKRKRHRSSAVGM